MDNKTTTINTIPVERVLVKQPPIRPVQLADPKFMVVTEKNIEEFQKKYITENGNFVLYVISPNDYKKLVRNQAELKRYISQQKSVIVYYENTL